MADLTLFHAFLADVMNGQHSLDVDQLKLMLVNTLPSQSTASTTADLAGTEIAAGNGYVAGGYNVTVTSSSQTAGVYKLLANDVNVVASGGAIATWQYPVLYNSVNNRVVGFWDKGAPVDLVDGAEELIDINDTNGAIVLNIGTP